MATFLGGDFRVRIAWAYHGRGLPGDGYFSSPGFAVTTTRNNKS